MDLIVEFLRHNTMMNRRLLEACRSLSTEELGTSLPGTYGSIAATLVHVADAQVGYAARLLDTPRPEGLAEQPFPGLDAVSELFERGNRELELAAQRDHGDREVVVTGDDPPGRWRMPVALFLLQAVNHATEHRSQIATTLTHLGVQPPEMDGWTYFFDAGLMIPV